MKTSKLVALVSAFAAAALVAVAADAPAAPAKPYTVTLSDAHVCCHSCVVGASAAVASLKDVKADADIDKKTIVITAPDKASAQKAMDALTAAGYFGKSSDAAIKVDGATGAKDEKVSSLEVKNLHLCCGSCVKAVNAVLADVPGYKANDAKVKAATFTITGDFKPTDVFAALQKAGLTGKAGATKPEAAAPATAPKS
jgi:copper chaperone CopZ